MIYDYTTKLINILILIYKFFTFKLIIIKLKFSLPRNHPGHFSFSFIIKLKCILFAL